MSTHETKSKLKQKRLQSKEQIWRGKNESECTRKVEIRTRKKFLAVGEGETQSIQACLLSLAMTVQDSVTGCNVLSHIMHL